MVGSLVALLKSTDNQIVTCCAGVINNLICNNRDIKKAVVQAGGLQALIYVMQKWHMHKDLIEPSVCALRALTNNHDEADMAQNLLINEMRVLPYLVNLLGKHMGTVDNSQVPHWPSVKAILGLLRNLASRPANFVMLRETGAVNMITRVFLFVAQGILVSTTLFVNC